MNVSEAIRMKRAVRQFLDKPLPEESVSTILNAGRRARCWASQKISIYGSHYLSATHFPPRN